MSETFEDVVHELADERFSECEESCRQGGLPIDFTHEDFVDDAREFLMRAIAAYRRAA
ncbi:hypothetical protein QBK99_25675 [Corticibacterium sp. UT-5YL-CI-8]|nr:hypothetical protein [Tianweitania sp. UT-5YL-CI-8]